MEFDFNSRKELEYAEDLVNLALIAASGIHDPVGLEMYFWYRADKSDCSLYLHDVETKEGRCVANIFMALLRKAMHRSEYEVGPENDPLDDVQSATKI